MSQFFNIFYVIGPFCSTSAAREDNYNYLPARSRDFTKYQKLGDIYSFSRLSKKKPKKERLIFIYMQMNKSCLPYFTSVNIND